MKAPTKKERTEIYKEALNIALAGKSVHVYFEKTRKQNGWISFRGSLPELSLFSVPIGFNYYTKETKYLQIIGLTILIEICKEKRK